MTLNAEEVEPEPVEVIEDMPVDSLQRGPEESTTEISPELDARLTSMINSQKRRNK